MPTTSLTPLFKWTGGKRREISTIKNFYPSFVKNGEQYTFVEPFAGAAAVFWSLNNIEGKNILNEFDTDVTNFYTQIKNQNTQFLEYIQKSTNLYDVDDKNSDENHKKQESDYYFWRNKDRGDKLGDLTLEERAARFWIVNQLAFSGMRRFNKTGEFNVPYGHYRNLNNSALTSKPHVNLLKQTEILTGDYKKVVEANDTPNTFIFVDPPYTRVMKTYSADNEFGNDKHVELADTLKNLQHASFMVVIDKSELTLDLYKDHIKHVYPLSYGVNVKNRFATAVEHLIATNY